jgi:intracellular sulfur oxidation DsrE/DsrF family protein
VKPHPLQRRDFLASVAGGVTALAATACALPMQQAGDGAFERSAPAATAQRWDDSWTGRLGRHRVVFDVSELEQAPGPWVVGDVIDAYHEALGTTDRDMGVVLILRHQAVPGFFSDALWAKYELAKNMKEKDPKTKEAWRVNPMRELVTGLQARGVTVLGCNRAVRGFTMRTAKQAGVSEEAMRREVMDNLLPGVILLPNGLYALARAQEVGCSFMR